MKIEKTKILWLSDIHYEKEYLKNENAILAINKFVQYIKDNEEDITHVIYSGDTSADGETESYIAFQDGFHKKLLKVLPENIKVISVPGNHDVLWRKISEKFEKSEKSPEEFFKRGNREIEKDEFSEIFEGYNSLGNSLRGVSLSESNSTEILEKHMSIDSSGNFGYYYDRECNSLFILINSAWLSFGKIAKDQTMGNITHALNFKGVKGTIEEIIQVNDRLLVERGNQTYGLHLFDWSVIDEIINEEDPFVISVAHHPPDWLDWSEIFTNTEINEPPLSKLTNISKLHLVGHEHSASGWGNILNGSCLMLNGGMFLDCSIKNGKYKNVKEPQNLFPNNSFSLIETKGNELVQRSFSFIKSRKGFKWEEKNKFVYSYNDENIHFKKTESNNKQDELCDEGMLDATKEVTISRVLVSVEEPQKFDLLNYMIKSGVDLNGYEEIDISGYCTDELNFSFYENKIKGQYRLCVNSVGRKYAQDQIRNVKECISCVIDNYEVGGDNLIMSIIEYYELYGEDVNAEMKFKMEREIEFVKFQHLLIEHLLRERGTLLELAFNMKMTFNLVRI